MNFSKTNLLIPTSEKGKIKTIHKKVFYTEVNMELIA